MKILIVGGTSALAQALKPVLATFAEVMTAGRSVCDVYLDLSALGSDFRLPEGIDVVINVAAHFGGTDADSIIEAAEVNVLGTLKLCRACVLASVQHFISISSTSAFLDETSDYFGIYALSKRQSEEAVQLFCSSLRMPCTILRPSQLYGNDEGFRRHQPFLYAALDRAQKNEDILIYGSQNALRNYLHVDDFCRVMSQVVINRIGGLYVCTSPVDVSFSRVAYSAIKAFRSSSKIVFVKEMKPISDNVFPYDESLYSKTGCFPQMSLDDGLKQIAAHRLSHL